MHRQEVENWNVLALCNLNSVYTYTYLIPYVTVLSYMSLCIFKNLCGTLKTCVWNFLTSVSSQLGNGDRGFENVELGVIGKKKKIPRRVIHFASGETMEEYSTDEEEDEQEKKDLLPPVDPTTLTWGPYLWFHMLRVATSTLSVCDFLGEKIASVLGISTPKYQYAIDEYYRMKREEEEEEQENKMSEEAERQHQEQQNKSQAEAPVQTDQPEATACTSFVNVNFENEGDDCQSVGENKQDVVPVPS
uniref:Family with sequence similarity 177 member A1 n=1 Tax=Otus sunia TaxID=257818 RepID=A0A8C8BH82_9STRI